MKIFDLLLHQEPLIMHSSKFKLGRKKAKIDSGTLTIEVDINNITAS